MGGHLKVRCRKLYLIKDISNKERTLESKYLYLSKVIVPYAFEGRENLINKICTVDAGLFCDRSVGMTFK